MPIFVRPPASDLVVCAFSGVASDDDLERFLAQTTLLLERARREGTKYAFITLGDSARALSSRQRSVASSWLSANADALRAGCACHALVLSNALQRSVMTAILWVVEHPVPIEAFATETEAIRWADEHLARERGGSLRPNEGSP